MLVEVDDDAALLLPCQDAPDLGLQFIERDLPAEAARMASDLGWKAAA